MLHRDDPRASSGFQRERDHAPVLASFQACLPTPFAVLGIQASGSRLLRIEYLPQGAPALEPQNALAAEACRQIERYLGDADFSFDLPFERSGTAFQQRVWREISAIPRGRTLTYMEVARNLQSAPRPVGGACGANRLPLVIPCHRVVASAGIGGFMHARGGEPIRIKQWLLAHERD